MYTRINNDVIDTGERRERELVVQLVEREEEERQGTGPPAQILLVLSYNHQPLLTSCMCMMWIFKHEISMSRVYIIVGMNGTSPISHSHLKCKSYMIWRKDLQVFYLYMFIRWWVFYCDNILYMQVSNDRTDFFISSKPVFITHWAGNYVFTAYSVPKKLLFCMNNLIS